MNAVAELLRTPPQVALSPLGVEQQQAQEAVLEWLLTSEAQTFVIHGLTGTGKTVLLGQLARSLPGAYLAAPTGKAASVLSAETGREATTLHRRVYAPPRETQDGRLIWETKRKPGELEGYVALIDEASMISEDIARDLLATGLRVVAVGDPGQLPPVNGKQFFTTPDFTLTHIHRQAADSPIIKQAYRVREGLDYFSDGPGFQVIALEEAEAIAAQVGVILCWLNSTRHVINRFMRQQRGIDPIAPPQPGEPLVSLQNSRRTGVRNGEPFTVRGYSNRFLTLDSGQACRNPPFEWLFTTEWERNRADFGLGYCLTVHKSQGSEGPNVLVIDEFIGDDRRRWLYTAITRASRSVRIARKNGVG